MEPQSEKSILARMIELRDEQLDAAAHLFIVCGQPSTEFEFFQAWAKEDQNWFVQFIALRSSIEQMQLMGLV